MKRVIALFVVAMVASLVVGCEKERNPEYYVLYFSARVVDTEGNPIQGICAYPEGAEFEGRSGYSNYMGELSGFAHIAPRKRLIICFEDVDGEANGGEYKSLEIDITHLATPPSKPDEWGFTGSDYVEFGDVEMEKSF